MTLFKKVWGWLLAALLWVWWLVPRILDWIGRTTLPDDWGQLVDERLPLAVQWLFSTPGWMPGVLAALLTLWLVWASWPRHEVASEPLQTRTDDRLPASVAVLKRVRASLPPTAGELRSLRSEIGAYFDGLLREIETAAQLRRDGLLTAQEIESRIKGFDARNGSYAAILRDDALLRDAAILVPDGERRRERPLTTARVGDYSVDGPFLSTRHANLVATIQNRRQELVQLLDDALRTVVPSDITPDVRPSLGFDIRLHYPQDRPGQFISLKAQPKVGLTGVVAIGSYATVHHTIASAEWLWSPATRMEQRESLLPSETMMLPLVERVSLEQNPNDQITIAGQELRHRSDDAAQGTIVLVKVVLSTDAGVTEFKKLYNFRHSGGRQFIDALDLEAYSFVKEEAKLS